jgi:hypothetical protein
LWVWFFNSLVQSGHSQVAVQELSKRKELSQVLKSLLRNVLKTDAKQEAGKVTKSKVNEKKM